MCCVFYWQKKAIAFAESGAAVFLARSDSAIRVPTNCMPSDASQRLEQSTLKLKKIHIYKMYNWFRLSQPSPRFIQAERPPGARSSPGDTSRALVEGWLRVWWQLHTAECPHQQSSSSAQV